METERRQDLDHSSLSASIQAGVWRLIAQDQLIGLTVVGCMGLSKLPT
jgi:hypothetical protein